MKYLLVNDRLPKTQSYCALCTSKVEDSYVREVGTRLAYCCVAHYTDHCNVAFLALEYRAGGLR